MTLLLFLILLCRPLVICVSYLEDSTLPMALLFVDISRFLSFWKAIRTPSKTLSCLSDSSQQMCVLLNRQHAIPSRCQANEQNTLAKESISARESPTTQCTVHVELGKQPKLHAAPLKRTARSALALLRVVSPRHVIKPGTCQRHCSSLSSARVLECLTLEYMFLVARF